MNSKKTEQIIVLRSIGELVEFLRNSQDEDIVSITVVTEKEADDEGLQPDLAR